MAAVRERLVNLADKLKNNPNPTQLKVSGLWTEEFGKHPTDEEVVYVLDQVRGTSLRSLEVTDTQCGDQTASALANLVATHSELKLLSFSFLFCSSTITDTGITTLAKAIEKHCALEEVCLYGQKIKLEGAKAIANMIRNNSCLKKLNLCPNLDITDEGLKVIADALQNNFNITDLYMDFEYFKQKDTVERIKSYLARNKLTAAPKKPRL